MTNTRLMLTTASSRDEALKIARALVERQHAACVSIMGPIESVYRWKDAVESATELMLVIKTTAEKFEAVRDTIRELHSYELPECVAVEIADGSPEYLEWIAESVGKR